MKSSGIRVSVFVLLVLLFAYGWPPNARAAILSLVDGNSTADIDTTSQAGMFHWIVDGTNQMNQQWFWYRVGAAGPESSIDTISAPVTAMSDGNFDGDDETGYIRYENADFKVEVSFVLDGGSAGSGGSDMGEQITVTNKSGASLDFHLFQYSDFDLAGTPGGDELAFINANAVRQQEAGAVLSETVIAPVPSHHEGDSWPITLNRLNDLLVTDLSDAPPIAGPPIGPGDMTWAYQWDAVISPGGVLQISKDKNLVAIPEPTTFALAIFAGLGAISVLRRRK